MRQLPEFLRGGPYRWRLDQNFNARTNRWKKEHREVVMDIEGSTDSPETWGLI